MGILSTGFSLITDFFPQAKLPLLGGTTIVMIGAVAFLYIQQAERLDKINLLQQQNSALTNTISNLTTANTALNNQVTADKLNSAMLSAEITNIMAKDEADQAQFIQTEQNLNINRATDFIRRNSIDNQSGFINEVNANMACFLSTFTNMEAGACSNGKFVMFPSPVSQSVDVQPTQ